MNPGDEVTDKNIDALIKHAYWNGGSSLNRVFIKELAKEAFPFLQENEGFRTSNTFDGGDLLKYLTDECAYDEALCFARRLVDQQPSALADGDFTWVGNLLIRYSNRLEYLAEAYSSDWLILPDRDFAKEIFGITSQLSFYKSVINLHPFKSSKFMSILLKLDIDLFHTIVGSGKLPGLVLKDLFAPAGAGKWSEQLQLMRNVLCQNKSDPFLDVGRAVAAHNFWSSIRMIYGKAPVEHKKELLELLQQIGSQIFSIDNVPETKRSFQNNSLSPMIINQPWLALQAREAGHSIKPADCRKSMKALEKAAQLFGRQWRKAVSQEDYNTLKGDLEALLEQVSVDDFASRKMPEAYVSVLAELMPSKGWVGKTNSKGRDNILATDLGL